MTLAFSSMGRFRPRRTLVLQIEVRVHLRDPEMSRGRTVRDVMLALPTLTGTPGTIVTGTVMAQQLVRIEKLVAQDTHAQPGYGTLVTQIFIGMHSIMPNYPGSGIPTHAFNANAIGTGFSGAMLQPGLTATVNVQFLHACDFYGSFYGRGLQ